MAAALLIAGCAHIVRFDEHYTPASEPVVAGATLSPEFVPRNEEAVFTVSAMVYMAAGERRSGPYQCLFTAWGEPGQHRDMVVHSLGLTTRDGRRVAISPRGLGQPVAFAPDRTGRRVQATHLVPALVDLDVDRDGEAVLEADVTIREVGASERRRVRIPMIPSEESRARFANIVSDTLEEGESREQPWDPPAAD